MLKPSTISKNRDCAIIRKSLISIISIALSIALAVSLAPFYATSAHADENDGIEVVLAAVGPTLETTSIVIDRNSVAGKQVAIIGLQDGDFIEATSSDPSIASVYAGSDYINVSGGKKGNATITVDVFRYVDYDVENVATLTLAVKVVDLKVSFTKAVNDSIVMYKGESSKIKISGLDGGMKASFSSTNKKVASVSSSGKVKAKGIGSADINIKVGETLMSYSVSVGPKKGVKAARWALKYAGKAKYSQPKRMSKGYFDCSSLTGRAYTSQGMTIGGLKSWSSTAGGQAVWCKNNSRVLFMNAKDVDVSQMLPGDLLFYRTGYAGVNPEYRHIDHVAIYLGNGYKAEVRYGAVSAVDWNGNSGALMVGRPSQSVTPVPVASGLKASKASSGSAKISWSKKSGVSGYKVLRAVDDKAAEYKVVATVKGSSKKNYIDKRVSSGHTYHYQVRAYKKYKGKIFLGKVQSNKYGEPTIKSVRF